MSNMNTALIILMSIFFFLVLVYITLKIFVKLKKNQNKKWIVGIVIILAIMSCIQSIITEPISELCVCDNTNCTISRHYIFKRNISERIDKNTEITIVTHNGKWLVYELKPIFKSVYMEEINAKNDMSKISDNANINIKKYNFITILYSVVTILLIFLFIKFSIK